MRILLIEPPCERFKGMITPYFPVGLLNIATTLSKYGYEVKVYDTEKGINTEYKNFQERLLSYDYYLQGLENDNHEIWLEIQKIIKEIEPNLVGISAVSVKYKSALKVGKIVKSIDKDIKVVVGGIHPTMYVDSMLKEKVFDFVIAGEGEKKFLKLVKMIEKGKIEDNNRVITEGDYISDLDFLPIPDRELLINKHLFSSNDLGAIMTSRGCPYKCMYCNSKIFWGGKIRFRSIENVIQEIKLITQKYKVKQISFIDDVFINDKRRTINFAKALCKENINVNFLAVTRPDLIDKEQLESLKKAGCNYIKVGIESGSEAILKKIGRNTSLELIKKSIGLLNDSGIFWGAFFIIGFPYETEEDIYNTLNFMKAIDPPYATLSLFTPYPQTKIFNDLKSINLLPTEDNYEKYDHHSPYNYFSPLIERNRFRKLVEEVMKEFDAQNEKFNVLREKFYSQWNRQQKGNF